MRFNREYYCLRLFTTEKRKYALENYCSTYRISPLSTSNFQVLTLTFIRPSVSVYVCVPMPYKVQSGKSIRYDRSKVIAAALCYSYTCIFQFSCSRAHRHDVELSCNILRIKNTRLSIIRYVILCLSCLDEILLSWSIQVHCRVLYPWNAFLLPKLQCC